MSKKGYVSLIDTLRKKVDFLYGVINSHKKTIVGLEEELDLLEKVIKGVPIDVTYDPYDSRKFKGMEYVVENEAQIFSKCKGSFWYHAELFKYINGKFPSLKINPETVRRLCQKAVKKKILIRVKPGTYIYNIHR